VQQQQQLVGRRIHKSAAAAAAAEKAATATELERLSHSEMRRTRAGRSCGTR